MEPELLSPVNVPFSTVGHGMPGRNDAREYRVRAQHCLDIANDLTGARKLALLEMAQAWTHLADQAERNQQTDLVYETPSAPRPTEADPVPPPLSQPAEPQPDPC
jgi:hypothetical protein